ncbi:uncharacterized protein LOC131956692 [Physella acuta]|uniref:uncharacterized protein LOC131956692 n=1 Tax=Physella acuta TaxID=109671 RepID=UPI0027DDBE56|nr:uncharacterized protein LOC131956692 [Physella acuta]
MRGPLWLQMLTCLSSTVLCNSRRTESLTNCHAVKQHEYSLQEGEMLLLNTENWTATHLGARACTLHVTSAARTILALAILNWPHGNSSCEGDYLHVGNDVNLIDVESMTSQKFCRGLEVRQEIFSLRNYLWIVFRTSSEPKDLHIEIQARRQVSCKRTQFQCSPVQCVNRTRVCDSVKHCRNGNDEFCYRTGQIPRPDQPPCFRCGDSTCVLPAPPRHDVTSHLWFLCDGYPHCPDGWDEKQESCMPVQNLNDVTVTCVPSDLQFGYNGSVVMWADVACNGVADCYAGEDEAACQKGPKAFHGLDLDKDKFVTVLVVAVVVILCPLVFIVYRLSIHKRDDAQHRPSTTSTTCTQSSVLETDYTDTTQQAEYESYELKGGGPSRVSEASTDCDQTVV